MNTTDARAYMEKLCAGSGLFTAGRWGETFRCPVCGRRRRVNKGGLLGMHRKPGAK